MGSDGDIDRVVLLPKPLIQLSGNGGLQLRLHAGTQYGVDIRAEIALGQAVTGNAVSHHAPQLLALFKHGDLMAHKL